MADILINLNDLIKSVTKEVKSLSLRSCLALYINDLRARVRTDSVHEAEKNAGWIINYLETIGIFETKDVTLDSINRFIIFSRRRENKNSTIDKRISSLIRMFNRLNELEILDYNPLEKYKHLKKEKSQIKDISTENAIKVLNLARAKTVGNNFVYIRNYIGILILFESGVRLNELFHIHSNNIDFNNNSIKLTFTKTSQERTLFFTSELMELIKKYLSDFNITNNFLMINNKTNLPFDKRAFAKYIRNLGKELGINTSISPHKWRHGFATGSLESGASLNYIKEVLGHSSISTTQIYLHVKENYIKEQHMKFSRLKEIDFKPTDI